MSMCNMEQGIKTSPAVEVWRPIAGWEGLYDVSSLGQVRSVECDTIRYRNGKPMTYHKRGKVIKGKVMPNGYIIVRLRKDGEETNALAHRLVAQAFIPNPDNLPEVNHKDRNTANNDVSNLEWCDRMYNLTYDGAIERRTMAVSRPIEQLTMDWQHVAYFRSAKEIERLSGGRYYERDISRVAKSKTTRCSSVYGFRWRYVEKTDNLTFCTEPFKPKNLKSDRRLEQMTLDGQHVAYYNTLTDACKALGAKKSAICNACRGVTKYSYGYRWRYVEN